MDREMTTHHDGHGLTEALHILADERDPQAGGASHGFQVYYGTKADKTDWVMVASIQFQHGPRDVAGSLPGVTEGVLLAVLIDRLEGFQAGPYACQENADQLVCLRSALKLTKARADARAARGVLGRNEK